MRPALLLTLLLLPTAPLAAQPPGEHRPIIDMHLHALPVDFLPGLDFPGMQRPASEEELLRGTLAALGRYNVVKAITSGSLEQVARWRQSAPDRILPSPVFPHFYDFPAVDELRGLHAEGKLAALGELTAQYAGLTLASPELEPYLAMAEELDVPVALHTGFGPPGATYGFAPRFRAAFGNPLLIEEALVRHPKLRLYLMHSGFPFLEETIALMHAHPQVYADLAVINWVIDREEFHSYLRRLMQHTDCGLPQRLMFGSDQMVWPEAIGMAIEGIESADFLSEEQKRDIFCRNAARFLRLAPETCE